MKEKLDLQIKFAGSANGDEVFTQYLNNDLNLNNVLDLLNTGRFIGASIEETGKTFYINLKDGALDSISSKPEGQDSTAINLYSKKNCTY